MFFLNAQVIFTKQMINSLRNDRIFERKHQIDEAKNNLPGNIVFSKEMNNSINNYMTYMYIYIYIHI